MFRLALTSCAILFVSLPVGCGLSSDSHGDADVERGAELFEQRKFSEALSHFERALDKPLKIYSKSDLLTMMGNCYLELDQTDKSLEYFDRAIAEDSGNHKAYVSKGIAYRLQGDYDKAWEFYKKALKLAPDYAELHASMGALAFFQEDYRSAIKHLERATELDDSLPVAHSNLALAYAMVGRFDDADRRLKKAVALGYHQPEQVRKRIERLRRDAGK